MSFDASPFKDRSALFRALRDFFDARGYVETDTPVLVANPIPESHIELFCTQELDEKHSASPLYLVPSPEVWLKLLLAAGAPNLYQIGRSFRNAEPWDNWHRNEFTMLEWYRREGDAQLNIDTMGEVLKAGIDGVNSYAPPDITGTLRILSMDEAFRDYAGFSLENDLRAAGMAECSPADEAYPDVLEEARRRLMGRLKERGLAAKEMSESADDIFHRLFVQLVEEHLPIDRPLILTRWPSLVPTLARRIPNSPWADRWELYLRGIEVANCYGEETDRANLLAYWEAESRQKTKAAVSLETDQEWVETVAAGLPRCSGAAVGMDRLLAIIRGDKGLEGLDLFSINGMIRR